MRNVVLLVHFGTKKTARAAVSFLNLSFKDIIIRMWVIV